MQHPFNGLFMRTTSISRHQKGETIRDFNEARDDGVAVTSTDHTQIICTSLQTDNLITEFLQALQTLLLMPNQQCKITEVKP